MSTQRSSPVSPRFRRWRILAPVAVVGALIVAVALATSGSSGASDDLAARTAELERAELERDREQVTDLNAVVEQVLAELTPVLDSMDVALPVDGRDGPATVDETVVAAWRDTVTVASEAFADPPSGSTHVNVARSGFRLALDQLASAVVLVDTASRAPDEVRTDLLDQAADLRTQAVVAWSIAATQLDVANIELGNGHVHHYLPAAPGSGAFTPDGGPVVQHDH